MARRQLFLISDEFTDGKLLSSESIFAAIVETFGIKTRLIVRCYTAAAATETLRLWTERSNEGSGAGCLQGRGRQQHKSGSQSFVFNQIAAIQTLLEQSTP